MVDLRDDCELDSNKIIYCSHTMTEQNREGPGLADLVWPGRVRRRVPQRVSIALLLLSVPCSSQHGLSSESAVFARPGQVRQTIIFPCLRPCLVFIYHVVYPILYLLRLVPRLQFGFFYSAVPVPYVLP